MKKETEYEKDEEKGREREQNLREPQKCKKRIKKERKEN